MKQFLIIFMCLWSLALFAQHEKDENKLLQLSGLVLASDSLRALPYVHVIIKSINRGTITDYRGFFSIVLGKGDTVIFSYMGFCIDTVVISDTLQRSRYSIVHLMTQDTIYLSETIIYPWPTPEQFRQAFLKLDIPDDDLERARKNLERERLKELGLATSMDAGENVDYYMRREAAKFYYTGQIPPMNIFNPLAWSDFFKAWKRGDFKRKK